MIRERASGGAGPGTGNAENQATGGRVEQRGDCGGEKPGDFTEIQNPPLDTHIFPDYCIR